MEFAKGDVLALRDELELLQRTYREHLEPRLIRDRGIRARDPQVRDKILGKLVESDPAYAALDEFRRLCDEAVTAQADVLCEGD